MTWVAYLDLASAPHAAGPFASEESALAVWTEMRAGERAWCDSTDKPDIPTLRIAYGATVAEAIDWLDSGG